MRIIQGAELNRYVDDTIPLTWAIRWRSIKLALPLIVFTVVIQLEMVAFKTWLLDKSLATIASLYITVVVAIPLLILAAGEILFRISHRSKRQLEIKEGRVATNRARIPWKRLSKWSLSTIPEQAKLKKLTLAYEIGGRQLRWSMVLQAPTQTEALKSEVETLRQRGIAAPPLVENTEMHSPRRTFSPYGMTVSLLGIICLINGMPMLIAASHSRQSRTSQQDYSNLTLAEREKLQRLVVSHFSSEEEFRRFFLVTGSGVTLLGAGLYGWGWVIMRRSRNLNTEPASFNQGSTSSSR